MEIRRIRQTEADAVTELWDEAGRSVPDGGPLQERGRRNIAAMLVLAASSHRVACLVDDELRGFVLAELAEDGLLPCQYGRVEELYARGDQELERALVQAAVEWLFERGVQVIRSEVALDEPGAELLESLGFEAETTRFGLYAPLRLGSSTSNCTSSP
jgi:ribosomal protein S18 acetylase RimI-like enzyme